MFSRLVNMSYQGEKMGTNRRHINANLQMDAIES